MTRTIALLSSLFFASTAAAGSFTYSYCDSVEVSYELVDTVVIETHGAGRVYDNFRPDLAQLAIFGHL